MIQLLARYRLTTGWWVFIAYCATVASIIETFR